MKLELNPKSNNVELYELGAGETFELCNNYYIVTDEYSGANDERVICVDLVTGTIERICVNERVERIYLKVVKDGD